MTKIKNYVGSLFVSQSQEPERSRDLISDYEDLSLEFFSLRPVDKPAICAIDKLKDSALKKREVLLRSNKCPFSIYDDPVQKEYFK